MNRGSRSQHADHRQLRPHPAHQLGCHCRQAAPGACGFAAGKELAALDEHQVRRRTSWHRGTILALLACAFLSVLTATEPDDSRTHHDQLVPLTRHEIRRLFTGLCQLPGTPAMQLKWSRRRRRHQATARARHHRRRALVPA